MQSHTGHKSCVKFRADFMSVSGKTFVLSAREHENGLAAVSKRVLACERY